MTALAYVWSRPYGRLALTCITVGVIGLVAHLWLPVLTVLALPRDTRWGAA